MAGPPKRLPPRLDRLPPAGLPAPSEAEEDGGAAGWEHVRIVGAVPAVPGVRRYRFERCELRGVTLPESCRELQVVDCAVATLDLANASLQSFEASGSSFTGCRFLGAALHGTIVRSVFTDCQFTMAALRMCRLSDVDFHGCAMREVDFYGAALRSVLFQSCDLTAATLSRASFGGCAMRDCRLDDLWGVEALRRRHPVRRPDQPAAAAGAGGRHRDRGRRRDVTGRNGQSVHQSLTRSPSPRCCGPTAM